MGQEIVREEFISSTLYSEVSHRRPQDKCCLLRKFALHTTCSLVLQVSETKKFGAES